MKGIKAKRKEQAINTVRTKMCARLGYHSSLFFDVMYELDRREG
jgi:hypothetical protein